MSDHIAGRELDAAVTRELELAGIIPAPAGRRHPERSTMPSTRQADRDLGTTRPDHFGPDESYGGSSAPMGEQESSYGDQLGLAMQWLGLVDASMSTLEERVAERPLAAAPRPEPSALHHETEVYRYGLAAFRAACLDCDWFGPERPIRQDAVGDAVEHEDG